ncbi:ArsR family transcriptional regulator [Lactiplantibacillus plantarum subsp. plantarum]|uniref:Spx/MgsR family RNA polymerase-binding regulatory protein n=1 Tax=Lactiplantibacillus plantarum TaxID=1590 RepID=UPI0006A6EE60|nr:Spx/MgsR family RNA polymerase-binding regulatory protein [Lactiplantibacillus plantarum]ASI64146.1 ArsR family transcriptional regulator [Lactiplantibacillus plantarum subsp. plantarum]UOC08715.1 Spx/MgsR family RNA polymerase-binding regulatory protein [Lactiplantibacillus plantarum]
MIRLYTQSSCHSSRVARQWLEAHGIEFKEKNFSVDSPTVQDLKRILSLTEHGVDDTISARSKDYPEIAPKLPEMPLNEALKLLCDHPKLLRRPIIISDSKIQVGFNEDDIRQFIPRPVRRLKFNALLSRLDGNTGDHIINKRMVE